MEETNNNGSEVILQACLDAILSGQETLDSVIEQYPELEMEVRSQLDFALWLQSFKDKLDPRPEFIPASRSRLVARIQQESGQKPARPNWLTWLFPLVPRWQTSAVRLVIILFLVLSIFSGSGIILSAAQTALPGEPLYPVKRAQEKIALAISLDDANDAMLSYEFTQRRLKELLQLIAKGRYDLVKPSTAGLQDQVDQTIEKLEKISDRNPPRAQVLATDLGNLLSAQQDSLSSLQQNEPDAKPSVDEVLQVSQNGVDAVNALLDKLPVAALTTATPTPWISPTPMPTATRIKTLRPTSTIQKSTPTPVPTDRPLGTYLPQPSDTPQATATRRPLSTPTLVPSETAEPKPTKAPSLTPSPTATNMPTFTPTNTPTFTPTPTYTPTSTNTPSETPTATYTATPTLTDTPTPTPTDTLIPSPTPTNTPTETSTPTITTQTSFFIVLPR